MDLQEKSMIGTWIGTYRHESKRIPEARRKQKTRFVMKINQYDGIHFSGTIHDDPETGGTRGTGIVKGKIKGSSISFVKQMPVQTSIDKNGMVIEEERKHRKIYYSGQMRENSAAGMWKFKTGIGFVRKKLALFLPIKGSWEMTKE
jgi:hypothetical protein